MQPDATGFPATVLKPDWRAAYNSPAAMVVLPMSVSVPAMKYELLISVPSVQGFSNTA
jgi:hypothetical protein